MFCPTCGGEFQPGIERCPDCEEILVEQLPEESHEAGEMVEVFETADADLLPVVKSVLQAAGVPFFIQGEEAFNLIPLGGIAGPFARHGLAARFWVPEDRAPEAEEILSQLTDEPSD